VNKNNAKPRCHYCLLTPTGVVHDARGCVLVCADHKRARQQQSMISGHRNCPLYYPDDGPLWRDADLDAELAEDRRVIATRSTPGPVRWDGGTLVEADHDSAVGISIDQAAGNPNAPFIVRAWTRYPELVELAALLDRTLADRYADIERLRADLTQAHATQGRLAGTPVVPREGDGDGDRPDLQQRAVQLAEIALQRRLPGTHEQRERYAKIAVTAAWDVLTVPLDQFQAELADALKQQITLDAGGAAMRQALGRCLAALNVALHYATVPPQQRPASAGEELEGCRVALALGADAYEHTDAGRALLERLDKVEAQAAAMRRALGVIARNHESVHPANLPADYVCETCRALTTLDASQAGRALLKRLDALERAARDHLAATSRVVEFARHVDQDAPVEFRKFSTAMDGLRAGVRDVEAAEERLRAALDPATPQGGGGRP
jgi:hypothetical protein